MRSRPGHRCAGLDRDRNGRGPVDHGEREGARRPVLGRSGRRWQSVCHAVPVPALPVGMYRWRVFMRRRATSCAADDRGQRTGGLTRSRSSWRAPGAVLTASYKASSRSRSCSSSTRSRGPPGSHRAVPQVAKHCREVMPMPSTRYTRCSRTRAAPWASTAAFLETLMKPRSTPSRTPRGDARRPDPAQDLGGAMARVPAVTGLRPSGTRGHGDWITQVEEPADCRTRGVQGAVFEA